MNKIYITFLLITFVLINISAQTDFRPGYIITNQQDTLFGQIDFRGDLRNSNICDFIEKGKTKKVSFKPFEIEGYRFENSKYYISKKWNKTTLFVEFLVNGKLRLYYFKDVEKDHFLIEKDGQITTEIPFSKWIETRDGRTMEINGKTHWAILKFFTSDAINFENEIKMVDQPDAEKLIRFAEKYHNKVSNDINPIIYRKNNMKNKFYFGPEIGYKSFNNTLETYESSGIFGGLTLFVTMPRISERLQFKSGVLFSKAIVKYQVSVYGASLEKSKEIFDIIIPVYLQYAILNKAKSPTFSFGYNIGKSPSISPAASLGYMIKVKNKNIFTVNIGAEFLGNGSNVFIPRTLLAKQFGVNYFFKL
ncbi:MAG: hypothetical protein V4683_19765 [Bacteroidota bacterium]